MVGQPSWGQGGGGGGRGVSGANASVIAFLKQS